jgi:hypothetical protein
MEQLIRVHAYLGSQLRDEPIDWKRPTKMSARRRSVLDALYYCSNVYQKGF